MNARVGARVRSPNHPLLSHASLAYFFRDLCNCHTGSSSYLTPADRNSNSSLHVATNHWFMKNVTKSCCSPVFQAKTSTEKMSADVWTNRIVPRQIGIASACVYYYLSCFSSRLLCHRFLFCAQRRHYSLNSACNKRAIVITHVIRPVPYAFWSQCGHGF